MTIRILKTILLSICSLFLLSSGCNDIQELEYKGIDRTEINTFSFSDAAIRINLRYYNPNKFGIDAKETNLSIYLNDKFIGLADQPEKTQIPKKSEFLFPVVAHFNPLNVLGSAFKSIFSSKNKVTLQGSAKLGKGGIYLKVPVQISEEVHLFGK